MNTLDNVTVRVTVEVTQAKQWSEVNTIAKSTIEDVCSVTMEQLAEKIDNVAGDAISRAQLQLNNTKRVKELENQNRLLAEKP